MGGENTNDPEVSREETPILYAHDAAARAFPLVSELDIEAALSHIKELGFEIEKSYPELRTAMGGVRSGRGDVSGRALLIARGEAEDKIEQRRVNYDEKLVKIHKMAMVIAGDAGYEGFSFSFDDWDGEKTEHRIKALRPVFRPHPTEILDQDRQLWTNAHLAERVGVSLPIFLADNEWEEDRIQEVINSELYQLHLEMIAAQVAQTVQVAQGPSPDDGDGDVDDDAGEGDTTGDTSGRGPISGGVDFNVATRKGTEG
jgi:hypothetical protein